MCVLAMFNSISIILQHCRTVLKYLSSGATNESHWATRNPFLFPTHRLCWILNCRCPSPLVRIYWVKIAAVSVNPVDTKIRVRVTPPENQHQVLGWDAVGTVESVGDQVNLFKVGDKVWYAGAIDRSGSNAQYHLVDQRIVAKAPQSLSDIEAAALPLTSITAWEILFDRFNLDADSSGTLLIIGAAGGVGSIMIQLAKKLTKLTVIATAFQGTNQRVGQRFRRRSGD